MIKSTRLALAGGGALAAAGLFAVLAVSATPVPLAPARPQTTMTVTVNACVYGQHGEADRRCTPGVTSPLVTQANLRQTICAPPPPPGQRSFIARQRPSTSVTSRIRDGQLTRYYYGPQTPTADQVREDHLISLELGGAPRDPNNLYPQRYADSLAKDVEEGTLHGRVCSGALTLADAQRTIVEHWSR